MSVTTEKPLVKVWDPIVRYGHWALVAAFAIAYFSADEDSGDPGALHVWAGYAVGAIVAVRVVWGLIGSGHARFSDFAFSPETTLQYLKNLVGGHAKRYLGHSPAAAAMIFTLLICLTATVWTGVVANGDSGNGPQANAGGLVVASAHAEENEHHARGGGEGNTQGGESVAGKLHGTLANITVGLVVLHLLGVGYSSLIHRENLVRGMVTGRKRAEDDS
jgi:cytochrome b